MSKRPSKPACDLKHLAAHFAAMSITGQESENLAERAQHTAATDECLLVQTARISDEADRRQDLQKISAAFALGQPSGTRKQ